MKQIKPYNFSFAWVINLFDRFHQYNRSELDKAFVDVLIFQETNLVDVDRAFDFKSRRELSLSKTFSLTKISSFSSLSSS